jgi:hypothetical protein
VNTIVGTGVGLLLNAALAPPSYLPAARASLQGLGGRIAAILDDLAAGLASGITRDTAQGCLERARTIASPLDEVDDSIRQAEESLKYHIFAERQRARLAVYHRSNRALEHAAVQTRVISRTVLDIVQSTGTEARPAWVEPRVIGGHLANLRSALGVAIDHFLTLIDAPRPSLDDEALAGEVLACRRDLTDVACDHVDALLPDGWALLGEVAAIAGQLVADLTTAANDLGNFEVASGK